MILIDQNAILVYTLSNNIEVKGTIQQIEAIAKALNEKINYTILAERNNLANDYYISASMGLLSVSEMEIEHLKNAYLKALRNYYVRNNFKDMGLQEFLRAIAKPIDSEIDMFHKELIKRL